MQTAQQIEALLAQLDGYGLVITDDGEVRDRLIELEYTDGDAIDGTEEK